MILHPFPSPVLSEYLTFESSFSLFLYSIIVLKLKRPITYAIQKQGRTAKVSVRASFIICARLKGSAS
jgi:hypothetical protein